MKKGYMGVVRQRIGTKKFIDTYINSDKQNPDIFRQNNKTQEPKQAFGGY